MKGLPEVIHERSTTLIIVNNSNVFLSLSPYTHHTARRFLAVFHFQLKYATTPFLTAFLPPDPFLCIVRSQSIVLTTIVNTRTITNHHQHRQHAVPPRRHLPHEHARH